MDYVARKLARFARIAVLFAFGRITYGNLTVILKDRPDEEEESISFGQHKDNSDCVLEATLVVKDEAVWVKLCTDINAALSECYDEGQIETPNLLAFLILYMHNADALGNGISGAFLPFMPTRLLGRVFRTTNDIARSREQMEHTYDISNEFYASFLSPEMGYCCPIFSIDDPPNDVLAAAHRRKAHTMIEKARVCATDHVLDIGAGWGFLALELVRKTGCSVTAITLSLEQKRWADARIEEAGFSDKIQFLLCDYREAPKKDGGYDKIISMAMYEHCGKDYLKTYFATISQLLKPRGGIMVIDGTTLNEGSVEKPSNLCNLLRRYAFPGLYTPTIHELFEFMHSGSDGTLEVDTVDSIGPHYAKAYQEWRSRLLDNWDAARRALSDGKDRLSEHDIEAAKRKWIYYMTYFEATVRLGLVNNHIITAVRKPLSWPAEVPFSITNV